MGGGPAGASAAIYSARKGIRTGVVADRFGGQVMDTVSIENFISVKAMEGPTLADSLEGHVRNHDVDIMTRQGTSRIMAAEQMGDLVQGELGSRVTLKIRSLAIATGVRWREIMCRVSRNIVERVSLIAHTAMDLRSKGKKWR